MVARGMDLQVELVRVAGRHARLQYLRELVSGFDDRIVQELSLAWRGNHLEIQIRRNSRIRPDRTVGERHRQATLRVPSNVGDAA
jgi:hypothetical protein